VSSPSTHQNRLNQQKTKEKNISSKWHTSYAPPDKIEAGKKQGKPRQRAGVFHARNPEETIYFLIDSYKRSGI
jgi:hypothetical protein